MKNQNSVVIEKFQEWARANGLVLGNPDSIKFLDCAIYFFNEGEINSYRTARKSLTLRESLPDYKDIATKAAMALSK